MKTMPALLFGAVVVVAQAIVCAALVLHFHVVSGVDFALPVLEFVDKVWKYLPVCSFKKGDAYCVALFSS